MKKWIFAFAVFLILLGCRDGGNEVAPLYYGRCLHVACFAADTMHEHGHQVRIVESLEGHHVECQALIDEEWKYIRLGGCSALGYGVVAYDQPSAPLPDPQIYTYEQWKTWGY